MLNFYTQAGRSVQQNISGIENSLQETSFYTKIISITPAPAVYWILEQKVRLNLLQKKNKYEFFNK